MSPGLPFGGGGRFGVYRRGLPFEAVFSAELHAGVVVWRGFRFGVCCRSLPFGVFPIRDLLSVFIVRKGSRFRVYRRGLPFEAVFSAELHAGVRRVDAEY